MSDLAAMIDIFKMNEISTKVRCNLIASLGSAINDTHGMNLTDRLVEELIALLDQDYVSNKKRNIYF